MLPWDGEFGTGFASAAGNFGKRGDFEVKYLRANRRVSEEIHTTTTNSPFLHDIISKILLAPGLDGVAGLIKGLEDFSAAHNNGKKIPFSESERALIRGTLFKKMLDGLDGYTSIDLDNSTEKAIRLVKSGIKAVSHLKDGVSLKEALGYVLFDRITNASSFNPTLRYAANEVTLLSRVADAIGYEIPDTAKVAANLELTGGLIKQIKGSPNVGDAPFVIEKVDIALKVVGSPFTETQQGSIRDALIEFGDSHIDQAPYFYPRAMEVLKQSLKIIGLEFTPDLKQRYYGKMVETGLKEIYGTHYDSHRPLAHQYMGEKLVDGLRMIGSSEASIAVEEIRIAGAIARADVRDYREEKTAEIKSWLPASLRSGPQI